MQNLTVSSEDHPHRYSQLRVPLGFHDSQQRSKIGEVVQQFCEVCMKALTLKQNFSVSFFYM